MDYRYINKINSSTYGKVSYHRIKLDSSRDIKSNEFAPGWFSGISIITDVLSSIIVHGKSISGYFKFKSSDDSLNTYINFTTITAAKNMAKINATPINGSCLILSSIFEYPNLLQNLASIVVNYAVLYIGRLEEREYNFVVMCNKGTTVSKVPKSILNIYTLNSYNIYKIRMTEGKLGASLYYKFYNNSMWNVKDALRIIDPALNNQFKGMFPNIKSNEIEILKSIKLSNITVLGYIYFLLSKGKFNHKVVASNDELRNLKVLPIMTSIDLYEVNLREVSEVAMSYKFALVIDTKTPNTLTLLLLFPLSKGELKVAITSDNIYNRRIKINRFILQRITEIQKGKKYKLSLYRSIQRFDNAIYIESSNNRIYEFKNINNSTVVEDQEAVNALLALNIIVINLSLDGARNALGIRKSIFDTTKLTMGIRPKQNFNRRKNGRTNVGKTNYYSNAGDKLMDMLYGVKYNGETLIKYIIGLYKLSLTENDIFLIGDAPGAWSRTFNKLGFNVRTMSLESDPNDKDYQALTYDPAIYGKESAKPYIKVITENKGDIFRNTHLYGNNPGNKQNMFLFSDAAVGTEKDFSKQEEVNERLVIAVLQGIMSGVKPNGVGIVKLFTMIRLSLRKVIIQVSKWYNSTQIIKPVTSRATNSEIYIIFFDTRTTPLPNAYITHADLLRTTINFMDSTEEEIYKSLNMEYSETNTLANLAVLSKPPDVPEYLSNLP